jgi:ketosteroid isomerase-like protein
MVVARGSETCGSILSYLNSFDSVGKYYCDNTTVRGGWTLSDCGNPAQLQQQNQTPQYVQPSTPVQQRQQPVRPVQPQTAPVAKDANLLQVSAPLKVRFESDLDAAEGGAGSVVTGTLQEDLMDGDTVIAPAGSQVHAQLVPTSYWADGSGDGFQVQATGIQVGDTMIPLDGTAFEWAAEADAEGAGATLVSFQTPGAAAAEKPPSSFAGGNSFMAAYNQKDADALAALYSEHAVLLPPNEPAIFGRDAIRAAFEKSFALNNLKMELEALETIIDGQLGYVAGRYRIWAEDGTLVDRGKYMEIWKAEGGRWLIHRDMHNSSLPVAEEHEHE